MKTLETMIADIDNTIANLAECASDAAELAFGSMTENTDAAIEAIKVASLRLQLQREALENRRLRNEVARKAQKAAASRHVADVIELNTARKVKTPRNTAKTLAPVEVEPGQFAEVTPKHSIRLYGEKHGKTYDVTYTVGSTVEYDSYNLNYLGPITSIGAKTVSIKGSCRNYRLKLSTFSWRNFDLDLEKTAARNAETMQHI